MQRKSKQNLNLGEILTLLSGRSTSEFQSYLQPMINAVRNPSTIMSSASSAARSAAPEGILSSIRNTNRKQLVSVSVVFAELLGFFTVGTMIGRMKIVGYHGEVHHEH
jgi:F-type H+-transporting ATPase subunit g